MPDRISGYIALFPSSDVCDCAVVPSFPRALKYASRFGPCYESWEIRRADTQELIRKGGARCQSK
jgi:hypothetical protein